MNIFTGIKTRIPSTKKKKQEYQVFLAEDESLIYVALPLHVKYKIAKHKFLIFRNNLLIF